MIVIDVETTGLNPHETAMISLGAVEFETGRTFYGECQPFAGARLTKRALEINGETEASLFDPARPSPRAVLESFLTWTNGVHTLIGGHNVAFDFGFLETSLQREGLPNPFSFRTVDLHSVAWVFAQVNGVMPRDGSGKPNLSLNSILKLCGLPKEPDPHNALTGAMCAAECLHRLMHATWLLTEFRDHPLPHYFAGIRWPVYSGLKEG